MGCLAGLAPHGELIAQPFRPQRYTLFLYTHKKAAENHLPLEKNYFRSFLPLLSSNTCLLSKPLEFEGGDTNISGT